MVSFCNIHHSMTFIILSNLLRTILIIVMMIIRAQLMNSNNDNGDDDHLNNLIFILLDQEKSQVLSSGKSKDLDIGKSTGTELYRLLVCIYCYNGWFIEWALVALNQKWAASIFYGPKKDYIHCSWCIVFINVSGGCLLNIYYPSLFSNSFQSTTQ